MLTPDTTRCPKCGEYETETAQRAKAARWMSAWADRYGYSIRQDSPVGDFLAAMRKLDSDGDFLDNWGWPEVWSVIAYWILEDEADHGPAAE